MKNLIDRYIYDVTRRLPEKERNEVSKELNANIYDMLPEDADENEIKTVLYRLGSPASLAEQYRQNPRYLISPAIYDDYIHVLKWVLPTVGFVVLIIGMFLGAIDATEAGVADATGFIEKTLSKGITLGLSAALQILVWTTVSFAIAERVGAKAEGIKKHQWKIEDLPESTPNDKGRIPLSDILVELVLSVAFSVAVILACSGVLPNICVIQTRDMQTISLFSPSFLAVCIPAFTIIALLCIFESIARIKERRYTPYVCVIVVISTLVSMGIFIYLINRPDLFSTEFIAYTQSRRWGSFDLRRFVGTSGINPIIIFNSIFIVVCSLAACGNAVRKTIKYEKQRGL